MKFLILASLLFFNSSFTDYRAELFEAKKNFSTISKKIKVFRSNMKGFENRPFRSDAESMYYEATSLYDLTFKTINLCNTVVSIEGVDEGLKVKVRKFKSKLERMYLSLPDLKNATKNLKNISCLNENTSPDRGCNFSSQLKEVNKSYSEVIIPFNEAVNYYNQLPDPTELEEL